MFFCLTLNVDGLHSYGEHVSTNPVEMFSGAYVPTSDLVEALAGAWADQIVEIRSHGVVVTVDYDGGQYYTKYWIPV